MIKLDDKSFLNNPDYNLAYEKLYNYAMYTGNFKGQSYDCTEKAYITSNEYLKNYFPTFNLENKSIATVGSSGDQVLNAILYGATNITLIDANIFARPFSEYKMALIRTFDHKTFLDLLKSSKCFHWKVYSKISHLLSPETQVLFDTIMLDQEPLTSRKKHLSLRPTCLDLQDRLLQSVDEFESNLNSAFYQSEHFYNKLQTLLNNGNYKIKYITAEFSEFPTVLKDKYNAIILSNIYDYVDRETHQIVSRQLYNNNLLPGGIIQLAYDYDNNRHYKNFNIGSYNNVTTKKIQHNKEKDRVYLVEKI